MTTQIQMSIKYANCVCHSKSMKSKNCGCNNKVIHNFPTYTKNQVGFH